MAAKKKSARAVTKLPKVMSKLIRIALKDLQKAEKAENVFVDMSEWFEPTKIQCQVEVTGKILHETPACVVCAAGSVMAFTLGKLGKTKHSLEPYNFPENGSQLLAINDLRCGDVLSAAVNLDLLRDKYDSYGRLTKEAAKFEKLDAHIPEYDPKKPAVFHRAMERLAVKLEKAGL